MSIDDRVERSVKFDCIQFKRKKKKLAVTEIYYFGLLISWCLLPPRSEILTKRFSLSNKKK